MSWAAGVLPEFPPTAWDSEAFAAYRSLVAPTTEAPDAFLWAAFAGVLSFLVGRATWIEWGARREHPIIFPVLVGETAKARKSTALHDAIDLVAEPLRPTGHLAEGVPDPSEIVRGSGSGEGFLEALAERTFRRRADGSEHEARRRTEVQTGRRALFVIDEFAGLLEKVERGQAGGMIDFLLNCFDARKSWTHRVRSKADVGTIKLTGATGVVTGATTLEWLVGTLSETHVRSGLVNRFLWFAGSRKAAIPRRPKIAVEAQAELRERITRLLGRVEGKELQLSRAAQDLYDRRYRIDYDSEKPDLLAEATGRSTVQALRIAMLLAIADGRPLISDRHVANAWAVVDYCNSVAGVIVENLRVKTVKDAETRVLGAAARAAADNGGNFTRRDVFQRLKGKHGLDAETMNRSFLALLDAEEIVMNGARGKFQLAPGART